MSLTVKFNEKETMKIRDCANQHELPISDFIRQTILERVAVDGNMCIAEPSHPLYEDDDNEDGFKA